MLNYCLSFVATLILVSGAPSVEVEVQEPLDSPNAAPFVTFNDEEVWKVRLGDVCQVNRFPLPASEPDKFLECLKPSQAVDDWPWADKGLWVMKQCLGGTEFYPLTRSCKSKRYIRRQQGICQTSQPPPGYCAQPTGGQSIAIQGIQQQQQMSCQCPPNVQACACPQPQTSSIIQPTSMPQGSISIQVLCQQQPQNSLCQQQCPTGNPNCASVATIAPPQPCALATGGATSAQVGGICSWMLAPLAVDPSNNKFYLQCHPAPGNFYCGRWVRMPCPPGTIFDVSSQVCANDPNNPPGPVNPQPQITGQGIGGCNCQCPGGSTNIGQCNTQNQCPGQSTCQPSISQQQSSNCQQFCGGQVSVCCYPGSGKRK